MNVSFIREPTQRWTFNPLESTGNYSATSSNMKLVSPPRPLLAVPTVTAHPSTASVPVTVLLCNGPLLCSFNVGVKELTSLENHVVIACKQTAAHYSLLVILVAVSPAIGTCSPPRNCVICLTPTLTEYVIIWSEVINYANILHICCCCCCCRRHHYLPRGRE